MYVSINNCRPDQNGPLDVSTAAIKLCQKLVDDNRISFNAALHGQLLSINLAFSVIDMIGGEESSYY